MKKVTAIEIIAADKNGNIVRVFEERKGSEFSAARAARAEFTRRRPTLTIIKIRAEQLTEYTATVTAEMRAIGETVRHDALYTVAAADIEAAKYGALALHAAQYGDKVTRILYVTAE